MKKNILFLLWGVLILFVLHVPLAEASAIQLWEQSESDLGDYHSGAAAIADDVSTEFYNPAGLTRLKHQEVSAGVAAVQSYTRFAGTVYVNTMSALGHQPTVVHSQGLIFFPNVHYAYPINNRFSFGFGIASPFCLGSEYGNDSPMKYSSSKTSIFALNIGPSLGIRINPHLSVGFGLDAQRLFVDIEQYTGLYSAAISTNPSYFDTKAVDQAYNWGYGAHAGLLYEFTPSTRIGFNYRSQIVHHATGSGDIEGRLADPDPSYAAKVSKHYRTDNLEVKIVMPATAMMSFYQDIDPRWSWMSSVTYAHWGTMDSLRINHSAGKGGASVDTYSRLALRSTWDLAAGVNYALNHFWKLKFGVGFDQSPVYGSGTPAIYNVQLIDSDRYAVSTGFHWQPILSTGVDVGYAHLFYKRVRRQSYSVLSSQTTQTNGLMNGHADIVGVQVTYQMI